MTAFVREGEWTGYAPAQRRVVYREFISEQRIEAGLMLEEIVFTDGTSMRFSTRQVSLEEMVHLIVGYSSLVAEADAHGGARVLVSDLRSKG